MDDKLLSRGRMTPTSPTNLIVPGPSLIPIKINPNKFSSISPSSTHSNHSNEPHSPTLHYTNLNYSNSNSTETETLKHRLRIAKAEVASLQEKLGLKHNPAPFGSSSPRSGDREFGTNTKVLESTWTRPNPTLPMLSGSVSSSRTLIEPSSPSGEETLRIPSPLPSLNSSSSSSSKNRINTSNNGNNNGNSDASSSRTAVENPFFGSGASRERMKNSASSASSGSGKVISGLQSDLIQARSALESTRQQLRLSQRAVEHLTRQNDDLKDTKERTGLENDVLTKTIARKERNSDALLNRSKLAEANLSALEATHRTSMITNKTRLKELETLTEEAEGRRTKAESEYSALRSGLQSLSSGFKVDLDWLRGDMLKKENKHQHDLEEARQKYIALTKIYKAREVSHKEVTATLTALQYTQKEFADNYRNSLTSVLKTVDEHVSRKENEFETITGVKDELARLRRLIQLQESKEV